MKTVQFLRLAASTLILGAGLTVGTSAGVAGAQSTANLSKQERIAIGAAQKAQKLIAKQRYDKALEKAELAVSMQPENPEYRSILGQAYLRAGRFQSAETAFYDSLALRGGNGRVALNLALTQIANGKSAAALSTLEDNRDAIAPSDRGLAIALSGDAARGVEMLEIATRGPNNDAKTRQNLALAYALAGQWANARVMAAQDLSPDMVDSRMTQWASFVRPRAAWDQVSSLLKITPVYDAGLPSALALNVVGEQSAQTAALAPAPVRQEVVPTPIPAGLSNAAYEAPVAAPEEIRFVANPQPIVQPIPQSEPQVAKPQRVKAPVAPRAKLAKFIVEPARAKAPLIRSNPTPMKQAIAAVAKTAAKPAVKPAAKPAAASNFRSTESGKFVVQLGAFNNEGGAQIAWNGIVKNTAEVGKYAKAASRVEVNGAALYRLSVSGFTTRDAAGQVCSKIKASGGSCFVRSVTGDAPVQWASRGGNKIAARR
jgi:Flp pilus assembly protein TadD